MKATFNTNLSKQKNQVNVLLSCIDNRPPLAVLELIKVESHLSGLLFTSSNLDNTCQLFTRTTTDNQPGISFLIDPKVIKELVKGQRELEYNTEGTVNIGGLEYPAYPDTDYPILPEAPAAQYPIEAEKLTELFKFTAKDELRPAMSGVRIGADLCASDGHRLITITGIPAGPYIINKAKFWPKLKGTIFLSSPGKEKDNRQYITVSQGDMTVFHRIVPANFPYPDFSAVIPTNQPNFLQFQTSADLAEAIGAILPAANRTTKQIYFDILEDMTVIHTQDLDYNTKGKKVLKTTTNAPGTRIPFNGEMILSVLKTEPASRLNFTTPNKPITLETIKTKTALIMPVIVYNDPSEPPGIEKVVPDEFLPYLTTGDTSGLIEAQIEAANYLRGSTEPVGIWGTKPHIKMNFDTGKQEPTGKTLVNFKNPKYTL